jgi:hypothetical protein
VFLAHDLNFYHKDTKILDKVGQRTEISFIHRQCSTSGPNSGLAVGVIVVGVVAGVVVGVGVAVASNAVASKAVASNAATSAEDEAT